MDKEQRKRMAYRTVIQERAEDSDIDYTVQVAGDQVELHCQYEQPWDNASGTGKDIEHQTWVMDKETLKRFIEAAQWCIQHSESFEVSHPQAKPAPKEEPRADFDFEGEEDEGFREWMLSH